MNALYVIALCQVLLVCLQFLSFGWEVAKWRHGIQQRERKSFPPQRIK